MFRGDYFLKMLLLDSLARGGVFHATLKFSLDHASLSLVTHSKDLRGVSENRGYF